eukprot:GHVU01188156.1.p1 GENE.GHVU01188156.1~~GHVU01188156.1.p1  ORF type:complete len:293 (-),score=37.48 GHVU01188156.1:450-1328(-)
MQSLATYPYGGTGSGRGGFHGGPPGGRQGQPRSAYPGGMPSAHLHGGGAPPHPPHGGGGGGHGGQQQQQYLQNRPYHHQGHRMHPSQGGSSMAMIQQQQQQAAAGIGNLVPIRHTRVPQNLIICGHCHSPVTLRVRLDPCFHILCLRCAADASNIGGGAAACPECGAVVLGRRHIPVGTPLHACPFPECRQPFLDLSSLRLHRYCRHEGCEPPDLQAAASDETASAPEAGGGGGRGGAEDGTGRSQSGALSRSSAPALGMASGRTCGAPTRVGAEAAPEPTPRQVGVSTLPS